MFKASEAWIDKCKARTNDEGLALIRELPPNLRAAARAVHDANVGWEWKHFWNENARLWQKQKQLTEKLPAEWGEAHDVLFEAWNKSEHAKAFLESLNTGKTMAAASRVALKALAEQLNQLAIRHFGHRGTLTKNYQSQFELGEFPRPASSRSISLGERDVEFYTWDKVFADKHVSRITEALGLIKTYSPESFDVFKCFTKRLVPIKQKEFVSYSLQSLPGHSFINLYHRDNLDLLDDLLHENGHHHLNHFLILENPLREDPDQIYYSPWRRTLRPIRGIYHAHLTFFFALKLYHDLALALIKESLDWPRPLKASERQKILARYLEEWFMLEFTAQDLQIAIKRGQVKPQGAKFLAEAEIERKKLGSLVEKATKMLSATEKKKLAKLQQTLSEQARLTRG